jgi:hypothetical protein
MSAGRAWFYDPLRWVGELDLLVDGHVPMAVCCSHAIAAFSATGHRTSLPTAAPWNWSSASATAPVPTIAAAEQRAGGPATSVVSGRWNTTSSAVRRVRESDGPGSNGAVAGFSNPVWILPAHLTGDPRSGNRRFRD